MERRKTTRGKIAVQAICGLSAIGMLIVALGCEVDSWMDPSVVGRWEMTPVTLPILTQLDIIDEPPARAPGTTSVEARDLVPDIGEYIIGPGDLITFTIFELIVPGVESVQTRRVDELGDVRLPIIGRLHCSGETPSSLEKLVSKTLEDKNVLKDAMVSVIVQEGRQKTYSVIGEPQVAGTGIGTYTIPHTNFRLLEAMALARGVPGRIKTLYVIRAPAMMSTLPEIFQKQLREGNTGGTTPTAQKSDPVDLIDKLLKGIDTSIDNGNGNPAPSDLESALSRGSSNTQWVHVDGKWVKIDSQPVVSAAPTMTPGATGGQLNVDDFALALANARIIEVPYSKLLDGELKYNVVVRAGDVIRVPAPVIGNVYIGGSINRPGTYALPGDKDLTLKQLIFAAGNLAPIAIPERVDLVRRVGDDQEAIVRINLRAIFNGVQPDFYLKPNDTINIGTSLVATPLAVIRNGFRMTYGFGFILDRNFDDEVFGFQPG